jgi:opacity protein-like surface antigen
MKTIRHLTPQATTRASFALAAAVLTLILPAAPLRAGDPVLPTATGTPAAAAPASDGWYVEAFGGYSGLLDDRLTLDGNTYDANYGSGFLGGAAVGYQWAHFSVELEFFYRGNDVDTVRRDAERFTGGDYASTNYFLNTQYTFGSLAGNAAVIRPYIGVGVGLMQEIDMDLPGAGAEDLSANWEFGFQALVGLRWEISPHWSLFTEGRYTYGGSPDLKSEAGPDRTATADYNGWTALAGVRWTF